MKLTPTATLQVAALRHSPMATTTTTFTTAIDTRPTTATNTHFRTGP